MVRIQIILFGLAAFLVALAGILFWHLGEGAPGGSDRVALASIGGPFALTDQDGHRRSDTDFRGRYMLLYFGYTNCPDVCPTTLEEIAEALARLGPKAKKVVPVFVTVDPERDTPAALKKYMAAFGPEFVGLTGSVADIARVARAWRVYFVKRSLEGGGYSVDHSSEVYLVGPDGKLVTFYDTSVTAEALAKDLRARVQTTL